MDRTGTNPQIGLEGVAVAFWRNCDTLHLWDKRCATPGWATNATGAGTAPWLAGEGRVPGGRPASGEADPSFDQLTRRREC